jgi:hypothetical protein
MQGQEEHSLVALDCCHICKLLVVLHPRVCAQLADHKAALQIHHNSVLPSCYEYVQVDAIPHNVDVCLTLQSPPLPVPGPTFTIDKSGPGVATAGTEFSFTIRVTINAAATGVTVLDTMQASLAFTNTAATWRQVAGAGGRTGGASYDCYRC